MDRTFCSQVMTHGIRGNAILWDNRWRRPFGLPIDLTPHVRGDDPELSYGVSARMVMVPACAGMTGASSESVKSVDAGEAPVVERGLLKSLFYLDKI